MDAVPPGAYQPVRDVWGPFARAAARRLPEGALVVIDARVAALHPGVAAAARRAGRVLQVRAGEGAKTLRTLARLLAEGVSLPRSGTLLAVGGGTIGDLATVAAHLIKRGVRLIHAPSTLLAAVDSSVGGKGAIHAEAAGVPVKNAAGVFHYPDECWICPELFTTLPRRALREGAIEAWKMAVSLSAPLWRAYRRRTPGLEQLIRDARALKDDVCGEDPYEQEGRRRILNFGHTFGHAVESLTRFAVHHGDAVGMGILCALDVGRAMGVTPSGVAWEVEDGFVQGPGVLGRAALARALRRAKPERIAALLRADKKAGAAGELRMVLLRRVGQAGVLPVPEPVWRRLLPSWRRGARP